MRICYGTEEKLFSFSPFTVFDESRLLSLMWPKQSCLSLNCWEHKLYVSTSIWERLFTHSKIFQPKKSIVSSQLRRFQTGYHHLVRQFDNVSCSICAFNDLQTKSITYTQFSSCFVCPLFSKSYFAPYNDSEHCELRPSILNNEIIWNRKMCDSVFIIVLWSFFIIFKNFVYTKDECENHSVTFGIIYNFQWRFKRKKWGFSLVVKCCVWKFSYIFFLFVAHWFSWWCAWMAIELIPHH